MGLGRIAAPVQVGPDPEQCVPKLVVQRRAALLHGLGEEAGKPPPGSLCLIFQLGRVDIVLAHQIGQPSDIALPVIDFQTPRDRDHRAGMAADRLFRSNGKDTPLPVFGDDVGNRRASGLQGEFTDDPAEGGIDGSDPGREQAGCLTHLARTH